MKRERSEESRQEYEQIGNLIDKIYSKIRKEKKGTKIVMNRLVKKTEDLLKQKK